MNCSSLPLLPYGIRSAGAKMANIRLYLIISALAIGFLGASMGCVGYVEGGYGGGAVVVPGPDLYLFGGGYERGRDVHVYSHRGGESRAMAHPAGGGGGRRR